MKKQIILAAVVLISAGMLLTTGCKKDDTTAPTITLKGTDVTQDISGTYVEPGFTATDEEDGDLSTSVSVDGTVTNGAVGVYTLRYNVSDAAGNAAAEQKRTVTVKSDELAGLYDVSSVVTSTVAGNSGTWTYNPTTTQSATAYNKILIDNFGGLGAGIKVTATVSGSTITIASQKPNGMQNPGTVLGTGTISGKNIVGLAYKITYDAGGYDDCVDTFSNHQ